MGNAGGTSNPLAAIPCDSTIDLVLDNVNLTIEDGEWMSNTRLKVAVAGSTWTITCDDSTYPPPRGKIPPCFIQSIVARKARFLMLGSVCRIGRNVHVDARESMVKIHLDDVDRKTRVHCSIHDSSAFNFRGAIEEITIDATFSSAKLYVTCDDICVRALASRITGVQFAHTASLKLTEASHIKKLHVHHHVDLGSSSGILDVYVDPACTIENPPRWIPLATALAKE